MFTSKTALAAAAAIVATSFVAIQPTPADAMPRVKLDAQVTQTGLVQKVGAKKRKIRRFVRKSIRRYHRRYHRHGRFYRYGYGYRPYAAARCHYHIYKVPGMRAHARVCCGHRHGRAFNSWSWY